MNARRAHHRLLLAAGFAASALFAITPARADDGGIANVGGAVRLLQDQGNVRMVSEKVVAVVNRDSAIVDCIFVLKNEGPADSVWIGFPDESSGPDESVADGEFPGPMPPFRSWVDGVEVACTPMPDADFEKYANDDRFWWTKRVYFPAGATRTVRDRYVGGIGFEVTGRRWFEYILWSGASWKGPIGSGEIEVRLKGIRPNWIMRTSPPARRRGNSLFWSFRDLEPVRGMDADAGYIRVEWWPPDARRRWEKQYPPSE